MGRLVFSETATEQRIDVSWLPAGIYQIALSSNSFAAHGKLIKQ
jgi:hypothetical protein